MQKIKISTEHVKILLDKIKYTFDNRSMNVKVQTRDGFEDGPYFTVKKQQEMEKHY